MTNLFAPPRFKHPDGSPKQFKELQQKFRPSATAQYLIDYARDTNIRMVDGTEELKRKKSSADYLHELRRARYSRNCNAVDLLHEFRHAVQIDVLEEKNHVVVYSRLDLRHQFMVCSILEADASYHEDLVCNEIMGRKRTEPSVFLKVFLSGRVNAWLAPIACHHIIEKSISFQNRTAVWHAGIQKVERALDTRFLMKAFKNGAMVSISKEQKDEEIEFLREFINLVCVDKDGNNYLLGGKDRDAENAVVTQTWEDIFEYGRHPTLLLFEHKERRLQQYEAFKLKALDYLSPAYWPLK